MIKKFLSSLFFIILSSFMFGQSAVYDTSVGSNLTEIDTYLEENIEKGVIPGGVFLVAEKGKIKYMSKTGKQTSVK